VSSDVVLGTGSSCPPARREIDIAGKAGLPAGNSPNPQNAVPLPHPIPHP
jgi:hypothetical protein